jgi:hypothetical protein
MAEARTRESLERNYLKTLASRQNLETADVAEIVQRGSMPL